MSKNAKSKESELQLLKTKIEFLEKQISALLHEKRSSEEVLLLNYIG